jgi:hypothetical protein
MNPTTKTIPRRACDRLNASQNVNQTDRLLPPRKTAVDDQIRGTTPIGKPAHGPDE